MANLRLGDAFADQIRQAIGASDRMMLYWSKNASKSEWVRAEYKYAQRCDVPVIPILLDGSDRPPEIARLQAMEQWIPLATGIRSTTSWIRRLFMLLVVFLVGGVTTAFVFDRSAQSPERKPSARAPKNDEKSGSARDGSSADPGRGLDVAEIVRDTTKVFKRDGRGGVTPRVRRTPRHTGGSREPAKAEVELASAPTATLNEVAPTETRPWYLTPAAYFGAAGVALVLVLLVLWRRARITRGAEGIGASGL